MPDPMPGQLADEEPEPEIVEELMEEDHNRGLELKDSIIPYAIRWYTGEAQRDESLYDEDEEEESEFDEDDEVSDDETSDASPVKGKAGKAKPPKEECKQQ